ncbi:hypothetical protein G4177_02075 [Corallococcus sp. ZKHCc1 1396]|uniref:Uncharacterized protein n=1 Tax=Corallococcus soli TaxID=2710757 RepID=A0ABR9PGC1_9BACT|nr:hypothetical protein [Corallococcus soli]MBE4746960.1 hypothetical protein [Corallococcus soli]
MLTFALNGILNVPMSTSAVLPSLFSLPTGGGLFALVEVVLSLVKRDRMTAEERALLEHVRGLSGTFGCYILEAENRDDLLARVDAVVEDPGFHVAQHGAEEVSFGISHLPEIADEIEQHSNDDAVPLAMAQVLGASSIPYLRELHRNLAETMRCLGYFLSEVGPDISMSEFPDASTGEGGISAGRSNDPLAFLSDPDVPIPVAEALLASLRLNVLCLSLVALLLHQGVAEPWLKLAIAEILADSSMRGLALMAALSNAQVSTDILPIDERLDPSEFEQHSLAVQAAYKRFNMAAERSGEPVYPSSS